MCLSIFSWGRLEGGGVARSGVIGAKQKKEKKKKNLKDAKHMPSYLVWL